MEDVRMSSAESSQSAQVKPHASSKASPSKTQRTNATSSSNALLHQMDAALRAKRWDVLEELHEQAMALPPGPAKAWVVGHSSLKVAAMSAEGGNHEDQHEHLAMALYWLTIARRHLQSEAEHRRYLDERLAALLMRIRGNVTALQDAADDGDESWTRVHRITAIQRYVGVGDDLQELLTEPLLPIEIFHELLREKRVLVKAQDQAKPRHAVIGGAASAAVGAVGGAILSLVGAAAGGLLSKTASWTDTEQAGHDQEIELDRHRNAAQDVSQDPDAVAEASDGSLDALSRELSITSTADGSYMPPTPPSSQQQHNAADRVAGQLRRKEHLHAHTSARLPPTPPASQDQFRPRSPSSMSDASDRTEEILPERSRTGGREEGAQDGQDHRDVPFEQSDAYRAMPSYPRAAIVDAYRQHSGQT